MADEPLNNAPAPAPNPEPNAQPAPAAQQPAPDARQQPEQPAEPTPPEPKPLRSSLEEALLKVGDQAARERAERGEPDPGDDEPLRDERGRFVSRQQQGEPESREKPQGEQQQQQPAQPADPAPNRFSDDAKAVWGETPDPVRKEIKRAFGEMENGLQQYQQAFEQIRPYAELAQKTGTTLPQALSRYVSIEHKLSQDFVGGLDEICRNYGTDLVSVFQSLTGQDEAGNLKINAPQGPSREQQMIAGLQQEIARLRQQIGGVEAGYSQQMRDSVSREVEQFAQTHEHFDTLQPDIIQNIQAGMSLEEAYNAALQRAQGLAGLLKPDPVNPGSPNPPASAHTQRPASSISGSPTGGSTPSERQPSKTPRDALDRAYRSVLGR